MENNKENNMENIKETNVDTNVETNVDTNVETNVDTNKENNMENIKETNVDTNVETNVDTNKETNIETNMETNVETNKEINIIELKSNRTVLKGEINKLNKKIFNLQEKNINAEGKPNPDTQEISGLKSQMSEYVKQLSDIETQINNYNNEKKAAEDKKKADERKIREEENEAARKKREEEREDARKKRAEEREDERKRKKKNATRTKNSNKKKKEAEKAKQKEEKNKPISDDELEVLNSQLQDILRDPNTITLDDFIMLNTTDMYGKSKCPIRDIAMMCIKDNTVNYNCGFMDFIDSKNAYYYYIDMKEGSVKKKRYDRRAVLSDTLKYDLISEPFKKHLEIDHINKTVNWNANISVESIEQVAGEPIEPTDDEIEAFRKFLEIRTEIFGLDAVRYEIHWYSQLIQQPTVKIPKAIMSIGTQGSGKSTMSDLAIRCLGDFAVKGSKSLECDPDTQDYMGRLLAVFEEINQRDGFDTGQMFKAFIDGGIQRFTGKYKNTVEAENLCRCVINSNTAATNMGGEGRRWFVIYNKIPSSECNKLWLGPDGFWQKYCPDGVNYLVRPALYLFKTFEFDKNYLINAIGEREEQQVNQASKEHQWLVEAFERAFTPSPDTPSMVESISYTVDELKRIIHDEYTPDARIRKIFNITINRTTNKFYTFEVKYSRLNNSFTIKKAQICINNVSNTHLYDTENKAFFNVNGAKYVLNERNFGDKLRLKLSAKYEFDLVENTEIG